MDKSRYTEIDGLEAIKLLLDDSEVYSEMGSKFYMKDKELRMETYTSNAPVHLAVNEALSRKWYIKKPFDVREEMLARPGEWVGAFQDEDGRWHKVGFDENYFTALETRQQRNRPDYEKSNMRRPSLSELDRCIPIEDVPKGEF